MCTVLYQERICSGVIGEDELVLFLHLRIEYCNYHNSQYKKCLHKTFIHVIGEYNN